MGYIYKISNTFDNNVYIGQTHMSIEARWKQHKVNAEKNIKNYHLYNAMRVHGIENFKIEQIDECAEKDLDEREIYWIQYYDSYNNGYNNNIGGDGLHKYNATEIYDLWDNGLTFKEIKDKIGISKYQLRKILQGYKPFLEQREERYMLSRSKIKSPSREVEQYTLDEKYIQTFPSIAEASRVTGAHKMAIVHCCQGTAHTANGYKWKYKNKTDEIPFKNRKVSINQYDLYGNLINTYESLAEATREMELNLSSLSQAVKNRVPYKGFMWKTT